MRRKKILLWAIALVVALSAMTYQRITAPTRAIGQTITVGDEPFEVKFPQTGRSKDKIFRIKGIFPGHISAHLNWKPYPDSQISRTKPLERSRDGFTAALPAALPGGRLEYYVFFIDTETGMTVGRSEPVVIHFSGPVPAWVIAGHIALLFIAMFAGLYAALAAMSGIAEYKRQVKWTFWALLTGGLVFGPLLLHYVSGTYWSGLEPGYVTGPKTLLALLVYLSAVLTLDKRWNRWLTLLAAIIMLAVFAVPHDKADYAHSRNVVTADA